MPGPKSRRAGAQGALVGLLGLALLLGPLPALADEDCSRESVIGTWRNFDDEGDATWNFFADGSIHCQGDCYYEDFDFDYGNPIAWRMVDGADVEITWSQEGAEPLFCFMEDGGRTMHLEDIEFSRQ